MKIYRLGRMETKQWCVDDGRQAIVKAVQEMANTYGNNYMIVSADGMPLAVVVPSK